MLGLLLLRMTFPPFDFAFRKWPGLIALNISRPGMRNLTDEFLLTFEPREVSRSVRQPPRLGVERATDALARGVGKEGFKLEELACGSGAQA